MALKTKVTIDGTPISQLSEGSEKRVILVCDDCGEETTASYSNYCASQKRHSRRGKTYCRPCSNIKNGVLKRGKPLHKACGPRPRMRRENHPNYGGGRWVASDGYVMVQVGTRQYRREHIMVMERSIGRPIKSGASEVVHHINLDKTSNDITNLVLLPNESTHQGAHKSLLRLAASLVKAGLVEYSRNENRYMAVGKLRELLEHPEEGNQQPSLSGDA